MRRYIATLKAYLQAAGLQDTALTVDEKEAIRKMKKNDFAYSSFIIGDIFRIEKGKRLTKADMKPGDLNYIGAISTNNGIRQKISSNHIWQPNCITVNYNGSVGCSYYQEEPFHASDDVNVLYLKNGTLDRNAALFFCTVLFSRSAQFNYTEKWNLERMTKTDILLPVKPNGQIDFDFIRQLISAQIKLCIDGLMSAKDLEISTTEKVVNGN